MEKTNLAPAPEPFVGGPETEVKGKILIILNNNNLYIY